MTIVAVFGAGGKMGQRLWADVYSDFPLGAIGTDLTALLTIASRW